MLSPPSRRSMMTRKLLSCIDLEMTGRMFIDLIRMRDGQTVGEEYKSIRKIDRRIMVIVAITFMAMEPDRSNISQALTDNFLENLGMTTNDDFVFTNFVNYAKYCRLQPWQQPST